MLCYCGCGNEVFDIQIDPRDQKIMACEVCLRAMKQCYIGLLSESELAAIIDAPGQGVYLQDIFDTDEDTPALPRLPVE